MNFEIVIETPDGREVAFVKDYPTLEIAEALTRADMILCDALVAEDYNNQSGRIVSISKTE